MIVPRIQPSASYTGPQAGPKESDTGPEFNGGGNPSQTVTVGNLSIFPASQTPFNTESFHVEVSCKIITVPLP